MTLRALLVFCFCVYFSTVAFAQEPGQAQAEVVLGEAQEEEEAAFTPLDHGLTGYTEWVWGKVVSVDRQTREFVVDHLDYDTFEYVPITLKIDEKTNFANDENFANITAGAQVNVDYIVKDDSFIARIIGIEKEGEVEPAEAEKVD